MRKTSFKLKNFKKMFNLNEWLVDLSICLIRVVKKVAKNRDKPVKVLTKNSARNNKIEATLWNYAFLIFFMPKYQVFKFI